MRLSLPSEGPGNLAAATWASTEWWDEVADAG